MVEEKCISYFSNALIKYHDQSQRRVYLMLLDSPLYAIISID